MPHNSENQIRSEVSAILDDQAAAAVAVGDLHVSGPDGVFTVHDPATSTEDLQLYTEAYPEIVQETKEARVADERQLSLSQLALSGLAKVKARKKEHIDDKKPTEAVQASHLGAVTATDEYWSRIAEASPEGSESSLEKRNAAQANAILGTVLLSGERPSGDFTDRNDVNKPPLVAATEAWWKKLGATNDDPRLAPALIRAAVVVLRDGRLEKPRDAQQDVHSELSEIKELASEARHDPSKVQSSSESQPDKVRIAELATTGEMLLDAAFVADFKTKLKAPLLSAAREIFVSIAESISSTPKERLIALGRMADIEAYISGISVAKAHQDGDKAAELKAYGDYAESAQHSNTLILTALKAGGVSHGFTNEVVTSVVLRYAAYSNSVIHSSFVRLAVGREDAAFDGLKSRGRSLNHDVVVVDNGTKRRVQLKAREANEEDVYDKSIIVMDGTDVIPEANKSGGRNAYADAQQELIRAINGAYLSRGQKPVAPLTPRQKTLIKHAEDKVFSKITFVDLED